MDKNAPHERIENPRLAKQLEKMVFKDQAAIFAGRHRNRIHKNYLVIKRIIKKYGFPTIKMVGRKGASNAWLLILHCDSDVAFQRACLKLMRRALKRKQALKWSIAYLEDRVRVNSGQKQIYGTQMLNREPKEILATVIDPKNIDKRRKSAGLDSFENYVKLVKKMRRLKKHIPPRANDPCPCMSGKTYKSCHGSTDKR